MFDWDPNSPLIKFTMEKGSKKMNKKNRMSNKNTLLGLTTYQYF